METVASGSGGAERGVGDGGEARGVLVGRGLRVNVVDSTIGAEDLVELFLGDLQSTGGEVDSRRGRLGDAPRDLRTRHAASRWGSDSCLPSTACPVSTARARQLGPSQATLDRAYFDDEGRLRLELTHERRGSREGIPGAKLGILDGLDLPPSKEEGVSMTSSSAPTEKERASSPTASPTP